VPWFYVATDYARIWLRPDQEPPERAKQTTQDKKITATTACSPLGFHVLVALPKGRTFDAEYSGDNILTALVSLRTEGVGRRLVIAENARSHSGQKRIAFCTEIGLGLATHGPYSPDLALSDFFLFGHVQYSLHAMAFASHKEVLTAIGDMVTDIPKETLHHVFDHWIERLKSVSQHNDNYSP
jgi:hypothetical protein